MAELDRTKDVPADDPPFGEHRVMQRVPGDTVGPLRLRAEPSAFLISANVRDVSVQGIGLEASQSFVLGTSFFIEAGPSGKNPPMELTATLRHATPLPEGRWLLGCIFSRYLTLDDIEALG